MSDVFDVFPAGILVVTAAGRVLTWNPALEELLEDSSALGPEATCCAVLGCRRPGTALEGVCVSETAVAHGGKVSDVVIELPGSGGLMVTVTATAFHGGRERTVLLQIQPARDRAATAGGLRVLGERRLRIRTLGETVVEIPTGEELRGDWLDQRPGLLLKFLVTQRHGPTHADAIAEALWPRARPDTTNTVRHFVHALRDKLEPNRERYKESAFVLSRKGGYQLNPERVVVDADEFESATRAGLTALAAGQSETASASFETAIALYRGEYLPEERYEEWAIPERERLRDLACRPLRAMATLSDDIGRASIYLERLAEMEPLDIEVQRELLGTWLRQGRRSRALRHYRALQLRLMREFGERVTFDLAELGHEGAS